MADPYRSTLHPSRDVRTGLYALDSRAATSGAEQQSTPYSADPQVNFPGYLPPAGDPRASEYLRNDLLQSRNGNYGLDDRLVGASGLGASVLNGSADGRVIMPLQDPTLVRREASLGVRPGVAEQPDSALKPELLANESNVLFVDGLPSDCTRREVAHLFRPFIGFEDIKVVHKEPRKLGDKAYVLCFVEFTDSKCALTALEALQGYKFDDRKPDAPALNIQFARFPFRLPDNRGDSRPRHAGAH